MHLDPGMQDLSVLPRDRNEKPVGVSDDDVQDSNAGFGREVTDAIVQAVRSRVDELLKNFDRYQGHGCPT